MRAKIIAIGLALGVAFAVLAAEPAPSKSTSSTKKTVAKKGTAKKGPVKPKAAATSKQTSKQSSKPAPKQASKQTSKQRSKQVATGYRRSTQAQPSADRYKEVQQALSEKGYFRGPVDGAWGTDSVDALKRFQRDQNIGDDGKLGSLSLIALGLGPKRDGKAATPGAGPDAQP